MTNYQLLFYVLCFTFYIGKSSLKQPHVIPFQIAIGPRTAGGAYPVRAATRGAETTTELELPTALLTLADRLLQPGVRLRLDDALALGRALGVALLAPPLRDLLLRSARGAARDGGRLQVQFQIAAIELAALPWEWVTVGAARPWSPALRDDYALVRVGRQAQPAPPVAVAGPLRVLAVASYGEALQLETLHAALMPAVHDGRIELRLLPDTTPQALELALSADVPHVLHCAAPVGFMPNGVPQLLIGHGLAAFDLAVLAAESLDLRLVTLTGPQGDASAVCAASPLLATTLLGDELPAVIAFGASLPASAAAHFAATCYSQLAEGTPVDLAVTTGRCALAQHSGGRGWGFPQLRLLPDGEQLFVFNRTRSGRSFSHTGVGRRPRAGAARGTRRAAMPFPRWGFIGAAAALLLALLLAGRSIGLRQDATAGVDRAGLPTAAPGLRARGLVIAPLAAALPTTAPVSTLPPGPTAVPTGYATVMTAASDTLDTIAARMGSHAAAIAALNHLDPQAPLRPERPLVIPVFQPGASGAGGLIIRRGDPANPKVALTFDIEIDDTSLYGILEILRARGIKGTFFVTGRWVESFPAAARAIVDQGHEIGNHSLTHPYFSRIGLNGAASELEETERIIEETTGSTARPYFRFPYGDATEATVALVAEQGYIAYHWSADDPAISSWLDRAAQGKAEANGGILLMHGRQSTVEALPGWLDRLAAIGLQPTTLGEVLK
jgi:peptidoglycan-N-acetylglucosamine deacetylase